MARYPFDFTACSGNHGSTIRVTEACDDGEVRVWSEAFAASTSVIALLLLGLACSSGTDSSSPGGNGGTGGGSGGSVDTQNRPVIDI